MYRWREMSLEYPAADIQYNNKINELASSKAAYSAWKAAKNPIEISKLKAELAQVEQQIARITSKPDKINYYANILSLSPNKDTRNKADSWLRLKIDTDKAEQIEQQEIDKAQQVAKQELDVLRKQIYIIDAQGLLNSDANVSIELYDRLSKLRAEYIRLGLNVEDVNQLMMKLDYNVNMQQVSENDNMQQLIANIESIITNKAYDRVDELSNLISQYKQNPYHNATKAAIYEAKLSDFNNEIQKEKKRIERAKKAEEERLAAVKKADEIAKPFISNGGIDYSLDAWIQLKSNTRTFEDKLKAFLKKKTKENADALIELHKSLSGDKTNDSTRTN